MATIISTDSPLLYGTPNSYFYQGASPKLLDDLLGYIAANKGNIASVSIASYLFNNEVLHNRLKELAQGGMIIRVVSIPLEGYDERYPKEILDLRQNQNAYDGRAMTKEDAAILVYNDFINNPVDCYNLYIFPHMYARSAYMKSFARGRLPYSLHMKSIFIEFSNGTGAIATTSSNLAVRDLCKEEILVINEIDQDETVKASVFFDLLFEHSIPVANFDSAADWFHYEFPVVEAPPTTQNEYIAPFYENSADLAEGRIKYVINNAKKRVYVCAQHVCAYNYTIPRQFKHGHGSGQEGREGILGALLKNKAKGLDVRILSQTFVNTEASDSARKSHGKPFREPVNTKSFSSFIQAYKRSGMGTYRVNDDIHSKFIIVDDSVIVTTFNYTPTQFMYLKHVNIPQFNYVPGASYSGVFCEIGHYIKITDPEAIASIVAYFEELESRDSTTQVI